MRRLSPVAVKVNVIIWIALVIVFVLKPPTDGCVDLVSSGSTELCDKLTIDIICSRLEIT